MKRNFFSQILKLSTDRNSRRKSAAKVIRRRKLQIEGLEKREMFSVSSLWFSGDKLVVQTDDAATSVAVSQVGSTSNMRIDEIFNDVAIRSWDVSKVGSNIMRINERGIDLFSEYQASRVGAVEFQGGDGNDRFVNNVATLPVIAFGSGGNDYLAGNAAADQLVGGIGNDKLVGGKGVDYLWGEAGSDKLYGGDATDYLDGGADTDYIYGEGGNDNLYGGDGIDHLYAGAGNDYLRGGNQNDTLYGEAGDDHIYGDGHNDNLYGGDGMDSLYGGAGNDGLFGGIGANDKLNGGTGADRFLEPQAYRTVLEGYWKNDWQKWIGHRSYRDVQQAYDEDAISDFKSEDAIVKFVNLGPSTQKLTGFDNVQFAAGSWTNAEIQEVDVALDNLHHHVKSSTKLLETAAGGTITLERAGRQLTTLPKNKLIGGWNSGARIAFVNGTFSSNQDLYETVYHEFGHNWDEPKENKFATSFRAISKWDQVFQTGDTKAGDRSAWTFRDIAANFARPYGQWTPFEDYATTWETYFSQKYHSTTNNVVAAKIKNLDAFFASLA